MKLTFLLIYTMQKKSFCKYLNNVHHTLFFCCIYEIDFSENIISLSIQLCYGKTYSNDSDGIKTFFVELF